MIQCVPSQSDGLGKPSQTPESHEFHRRPPPAAPHWQSTPDPGNRQQVGSSLGETSRMLALAA